MMDCKVVIGVLFLSTLVVLSNGFFFEEIRTKRQVDEEPNNGDGAAGLNCSEFPRNIFRCDCCQVPDDMFGDLRDYFRKCKGELYKYNKRGPGGPPGRGPPGQNPEGQPDRYRNDKQEDFGPEETTPRNQEGPNDGGNRPPPPPPRDDGQPGGPGGPGGRGGPDCDKKRGGLSEWFRRLFERLSETLKRFFDNIAKFIADRWRHGPSDGCLAECVFKEKGWLSGDRVNAPQIKNEISNTIDDSWVRVVSAAIDQCANVPAEEGKKCQSGSEEFFMCMGRETFMSCPNFKEEEPQCRQLREFYQRCPNAKPVPLKCHKPPPEGEYNRHHHHHHHHHDGGRGEGENDAEWGKQENPNH